MSEELRQKAINYANTLLFEIEKSDTFPKSEIQYLRDSINCYNETGVAWEGMRRFFDEHDFGDNVTEMVHFLNQSFVDPND